MSFDKVDPKPNFPLLERSMLSFWERIRAFDKLCEINRGKPKWSFLDGPITANNPMGVHHAWGRTYKDIYQRYQAALGRELRYQNGFDCQGLWVEVEVEKEHNFCNKSDIEAFGIDNFIQACKERVYKFAAMQTNQSKRLGYWMDWENSYYTMSDENNYAIWAFLKKCHDRNLIYKGFDVMPWCPRCGTGVSQMEMNEGYCDVTHTAMFVLFPILDCANEYLLVWTTTPWTLSANVAVAINPDAVYLRIRQNSSYFYVGKENFLRDRHHSVKTDSKSTHNLIPISKLFAQRGSFEIVEEISGTKLLDLQYRGPFDMVDGAAKYVNSHSVIPWNGVTGSEGTGIVHIAPGCGSDDFVLGQKFNLPSITPLSDDGIFKSEFGMLAGKRFDDVLDLVVLHLKKHNIFFAKEKYLHRYPHCWRCKSELVYRLVSEWFIRMNWRDEIIQSAEQSRWIPECGLDRELDWLRNMGDWMISKKRYWGLALPIWECSECYHFDIFGGLDELKSRSTSGWEQFSGHSPHRPWVDCVHVRCSKCGNPNVSRVKDVGNPWLDASIVPFSTMGYFSDREYWKQWFPAEFVVEAMPGQFRNWFYALLAVSTMMVGRSPFKVLKGHGLVLDDDGKPMHKSSGNAIEFNKAADEIGVDVMRWLYAATPPEQNVTFGPQHTDQVRRQVILPWWNVYAFFCDLARVDEFDPVKHHASNDELSLLDRWILSELHQLILAAHHAYSQFEVDKLCYSATRFVENLSTWYLRRSRRRFYGNQWSADKRAAYSTLYQVLVTFNRLMAPIVPFLTESIYQNLVVKQNINAPESVHHVPFPNADESAIISGLSKQVDTCQKLVRLGRTARKNSRIPIKQPLTEALIIPANSIEKDVADIFRQHLLDELNVKRLVVVDEVTMCSIKLLPNTKVLGAKFGSQLNAVKQAISELDHKDVWSQLILGQDVPVTVNGQTVLIEKDCVTVQYVFVDGWSGDGDGLSVVMLNCQMTPELRAEGMAREITRRVQEMRKNAKLDIDARIILSLKSQSPSMQEVIAQYASNIGNDTLAVSVTDIDDDIYAHRSNISIGSDVVNIAFMQVN